MWEGTGNFGVTKGPCGFFRGSHVRAALWPENDDALGGPSELSINPVTVEAQKRSCRVGTWRPRQANSRGRHNPSLALRARKPPLEKRSGHDLSRPYSRWSPYVMGRNGHAN
jgi:hypothetical protein